LIPGGLDHFAYSQLIRRVRIALTIESDGRGLNSSTSPPYLAETRSQKGKLYKYEMMTEDEHMRLLNVVKRIPARAIVSGYWSELYARELAGWRTLRFRSVKRSGEVSEEWLWLNFPEPPEMHDYRYLGESFRERERIKRKINRWVSRLESMPILERRALALAIARVGDATRLATAGSPDSAIQYPTQPELESLKVLEDR
jgi:hypothetical protein